MGTPKDDQAVIFLHGFGGNWSLLCFLFAQAVSPTGFHTVCPSTGVSGFWNEPEGIKIFSTTISHLKQQGFKHIYLAGLSNGALESSQIVKSFEDQLKGSIQLFGADIDSTQSKLPTLYIYGVFDERVPVDYLDEIVRQHKKNNIDITSHRLEADHFALLKEPEKVNQLVSDWLRNKQTSRPINSSL